MDAFIGDIKLRFTINFGQFLLVYKSILLEIFKTDLLF